MTDLMCVANDKEEALAQSQVCFSRLFKLAKITGDKNLKLCVYHILFGHMLKAELFAKKAENQDMLNSDFIRVSNAGLYNEKDALSATLALTVGQKNAFEIHSWGYDSAYSEEAQERLTA